MKPSIATLSAALAAVALAGCDTQPAPMASAGHVHRSTAAVAPSQAGRELAAARAATARYHSLEAALADGYVDIDVVVPGMGSHYLKPSLVDATFDPASPEILVYAPGPSGMRLVAVEYAIPLDLSATAPAGFPGTADVWDPNQTFGLWLLHAWVWHHNPDGMFTPFNPRIP